MKKLILLTLIFTLSSCYTTQIVVGEGAKGNQTSDDTFGQLTRYMGWVKRHLKDDNVKGIIIAGKYDKKLDYALEYAPFDTEVFLYNVSFTLNEFKK